LSNAIVVELGDTALCKITKFKGVVVAETQWINGCRRIALQPPLIEKEGEAHKLPDAEWFDEGSLEVVEKATIKPTKYEIVDDNKSATSLPPMVSRGGPDRHEETRRS